MSETNHKGDIAEQAVIFDLTKKNYTLFSPITKDPVCDLIGINKENILIRFQIKYCTPVNNVLHIRVEKIDTRSNIVYTYTDSEIDYFAVFNPETEKIYYFPISHAKDRKNISLRLSTPKNDQKTYTDAEFYNDILPKQ